MRALIICILLGLGSSVIGQTKGSIPSRFNEKDFSEHFVYVWNYGETTSEEITEAKVFAEEVYMKLEKVVGEANMPQEQLIITFGGEGVDRTRGRKRTPHVDNSGRIHLYRFDQGGYLSVLPHEMVHAIRINEIPIWNGFFEEGFASAIAYQLYPQMGGFPRFSHSLALIAGYWLTSGRGIPLETIRKQHSRLNLKCQLQTYVTREDFFNYLAGQGGVTKLVDFAYSRDVGSLEGYKRVWNKPFSELASDWEKDLKRRFEALSNTEVQIENYFETTSARYIPVCEQTDY